MQLTHEQLKPYQDAGYLFPGEGLWSEQFERWDVEEAHFRAARCG